MNEGSGNGASLFNLIGAPFLGPDYVRSLSLGGSLEFVLRTRVPMIWHQSMGQKRACFKA